MNYVHIMNINYFINENHLLYKDMFLNLE